MAQGEHIVITVRGRPIAELTPVAERPQWMRKDRFLDEVLTHQADPGLTDDLTALTDEMTGDLPWH